MTGGLLSAALLFPGTVPAEGDGWSLGPRAGFFRSRDGDAGSWLGGFQMRYLPGRWGVEGSLDFRQDDFAGASTEVTTWPLQASLLGVLGSGRFPVRPYLLVGGGWYFTTVEMHLPGGSERRTDDRFGTHAGAGLTVRLSPLLSLTGDYRRVWMEAFQARDRSLRQSEFDDSEGRVSVALNFHLPGKDPS